MGGKKRKTVYMNENFEITIRNSLQLCFLRFPFPLIMNSSFLTSVKWLLLFLFHVFHTPCSKTQKFISSREDWYLTSNFSKHDKNRENTQEESRVKVPLFFLSFSIIIYFQSFQTQDSGILNGVRRDFG